MILTELGQIGTNLRQVSQLRRINSEQIVEKCAPKTQEVFAKASNLRRVLSVVLPVRDGQDVLPATITALALSQRPVVAVVVSNGSTDHTVEIAKRMVGEDNVIDLKEPGLMGARQEGVKHAQRQFGSRVILSTDDDTLMPAHWAGAMERGLQEIDTGDGALLYGRVIWAHGPRPSVDAAITAKEIWRMTHASLTHQEPRPQGGNQGISFDSEGKMMKAFLSLDPQIFFREDFAVRDAMTGAGATVLAPLDPTLVGITRGGRDATVREVFARRPKRKARHLEAYQNEYGQDLGRYTG